MGRARVSATRRNKKRIKEVFNRTIKQLKKARRMIEFLFYTYCGKIKIQQNHS